jgi:hypothetical protein
VTLALAVCEQGMARPQAQPIALAQEPKAPLNCADTPDVLTRMHLRTTRRLLASSRIPRRFHWAFRYVKYSIDLATYKKGLHALQLFIKI